MRHWFHTSFLFALMSLTVFLSLQLSSGLPLLHSFPIYETIKIAYKKVDKTYRNGYVFFIRKACEYPQDNKYQIVGCICEGKIWAASESQVYSKKTRRDGYGARDQVGGIKIF